MKLPRLLVAAGAAAALSLSGSVSAFAATAPAADVPTPEIVGGTTADFSQAPYAAQLFVNGRFGCSASIISPTWVLTAKHCVEGTRASSLTFKLGSATVGQGTTIGVKRTALWSSGDVALAELSKPYQGRYATLGSSQPQAGVTGDIYGWGREGVNSPGASRLKTARVQVTGFTNQYWPGPSISQKGLNGQALYGDSGGPLIVNGKLVGVCSGPVRDSDIGNPNGNVLYASAVSASSWIKSVSGVSAE